MGLRTLGTLILVLATACGGVGAGPTTANVPRDAVVQAPQAVPVALATEQTVTDEGPRDVWQGHAAASDGPPTLAAMAHGPIEVHESPGEDRPTMTLEGTTILGTVTVLAVVDGPTDGWVEVMLPVRPNGSTGWIATDDVSLYIADSRIVVDLSDRELSYIVDGTEVLRTEVGIGSDHNQTPTGEYFVTDSVTLADPLSPWGPHALGISARSETITEFNGGDGIIGIHGTNNPGSVGGNISLGCVRLPNDAITALHEMVPLGTRVTVQA